MTGSPHDRRMVLTVGSTDSIRPPTTSAAIPYFSLWHPNRECGDDHGQRYTGVVTQPEGWFHAATFELRPVGEPDIANAIALVDRAVAIEPNGKFADLAALRCYLTNRL